MSSETVKQIHRGYNKAELAQEVFKLRTQVKQEEAQDPNIREANERAGQTALDNVTALSPEDMATALTSLGVNVNTTLRQVSGEIVQGRNTLTDLERACVAKEAELTNLFGQEVIARSIGNALADHDAKKKDFKLKEAELEESLTRAEATFAQQRSEWQGQFTKDCERSRTEFEYDFAQTKRTQKDAFAASLKAERQTFDDTQRVAQRNAAEAEDDLQKRLLAVAEQEQEAEGAEEKIKAKAESDKKAAIEAISRNHKHEMAITQKDAQTAAQIAASTIQVQESQIGKHEAQIDQLKQQIAEAQGKNTELAQSALESASRSFALDAVMKQGQDGQGRPARGKA